MELQDKNKSNGPKRHVQNTTAKAKQYTFFSVLHRNFSKIVHIIMTYSKSQQILQNKNNIMHYFGQQLNKYTIESQTHVD